MDVLQDAFTWLNDPLNWTGRDGVLALAAEHLRISALAVLLAALVGAIVLSRGAKRRVPAPRAGRLRAGRPVGSNGTVAATAPRTAPEAAAPSAPSTPSVTEES